MPATLRQAVQAAQQQRQFDPIQKAVNASPTWRAAIAAFDADTEALLAGTKFAPVPRVALTTPVALCNGVEAVITGHSTCDCNSYRVSWFDRRHWAVAHKWVQRGAFEVLETKTPASTEIKTGAS